MEASRAIRRRIFAGTSSPFLVSESLVEQLRPFLALVEESSTVDKGQTWWRGLDATVGWNVAARCKNALALLEKKICKKGGGVGMRGFPEYGDAGRQCHDRAQGDRRDRRTGLFHCREAVAIDRQRERHLAGSHQIGQQCVPLADRHAVPGDDVM